MSSEFKKERAVLRRRLQAHREQLVRQFSENDARGRRSPGHHLLDGGDRFPRSITMRILANRQNFVLIAVAELLPLLLRHLLRSAAQPEQENPQQELNV